MGTTLTQTCAVVDESRLARARAGEMAALEELFRAVEAPVYGLLRRLTRSPEDAEDLLHDTFIEVADRLVEFRGDGAIEGWIKRIAARKALMKLRRRRLVFFGPLEVDDSGEGVLPEDSRTVPPDRHAIARVDLETALARLAPLARAVLWLHDVEGCTHAEIGNLTGRSASFSKSQLARAHRRLRLILDGEAPND